MSDDLQPWIDLSTNAVWRPVADLAKTVGRQHQATGNGWLDGARDRASDQHSRSPGAEDPTVWTRPWTAKQQFTKQSEAQNRIYYEPRCIEGNYGLPGLLHGRRLEEVAFAQGRGVDPRTRDSNKAGGLEPDPLQ